MERVSIPRMELNAATVAVKVDALLQREMQLPLDISIFWTDSTTVLKYMQNENALYQIFIANRLQIIGEAISPCQWRFVDTENNLADDCLHGLNYQNFIDNHR